MEKVIETILTYGKQSSTWKGIFALLTAFGVVVQPDLANAIIALGLSVIGLVDVIRNPHKKE